LIDWVNWLSIDVVGEMFLEGDWAGDAADALFTSATAAINKANRPIITTPVILLRNGSKNVEPTIPLTWARKLGARSALLVLSDATDLSAFSRL
jgi:hypothetical protein